MDYIQANRIRAVQQALVRRALLHGEYRRGRLDMATLNALLAWRASEATLEDTLGSLIDNVDFPAFVSDLIHGVFDAQVDVSVKQLESYHDLLCDLARRATVNHD
jgi:hypothetical protein